MAMIDLILETARRLGMDRAPRGLSELHRAYLRDHPDATVGRSEGSFSATLNYHTINMQSRFPKPQEPRAPASWLKRPAFKRVGHGQYLLLTEAEVAWFQGALARDDSLIWQGEYEVPPPESPAAEGAPGRHAARAPDPPHSCPDRLRPEPPPARRSVPGDLEGHIRIWLASHDDRLKRFETPLPLEQTAGEMGVRPEDLRARLEDGRTPPYHLWPHTHARRRERTKPYCLRLGGPDAVGLDWEDSVVGAAESVFVGLGFETKRQLGNPAHVADLSRVPRLSPLVPGKNLRDLWALRAEGRTLDLWIIEAKGKEAGEFDYYCVAEALGQLFPVPAEPLSQLLGEQRSAGHGHCWSIAQKLASAWQSAGFQPRITLGLLLPLWRPDVVWRNKRLSFIPGAYLDRSVTALGEFLGGGESEARTGRYKYQRAFGSVLEEIEATCDLRALAAATDGLRFRVLLATTNQAGGFQLLGLD